MDININHLHVFVNMQNDFIEADAPLGSEENQTIIVPKIITYINKHNSYDDYSVLLQDCHFQDMCDMSYLNLTESQSTPALHALAFTHGWEIYPPIKEAFNSRVPAYDYPDYPYYTKRKYTYADPLMPSVFARLNKFTHFNIATILGFNLETDVFCTAVVLRCGYADAAIEVDASLCGYRDKEKAICAIRMLRNLDIKVKHSEERFGV